MTAEQNVFDMVPDELDEAAAAAAFVEKDFR
jgi:hypothetical protein